MSAKISLEHSDGYQGAPRNLSNGRALWHMGTEDTEASGFLRHFGI